MRNNRRCGGNRNAPTVRRVSVSPTYPHEREADVVLRDGSTVHVRPVRADDERADPRLPRGALARSRSAFASSARPISTGSPHWSVDVDYADRFALVAVSGAPPAIIAHAAYVRTGRGARRGRVPGRRRLAGTRHRDDPARPPRGDRRAARHHDVHRRGAAAQPPHDRGVPRERLPGRHALDA